MWVLASGYNMQILYDSIGTTYARTRRADPAISAELARLVEIAQDRRFLDRQGRFVIFTAFQEQMHDYWLCNYFPEMMRRSIEKMPAQSTMIDALLTAGFEIERVIPFYVTSEHEDLFLYSGKERPEFYFDPLVRSNISSFATLCPEKELQAGLSALRSDLESGQFPAIAQRYSSPHGDYAYVVANKRPR